MEDKIVAFSAFCVEMYALEKNESGNVVWQRFERHGIPAYLEKNYEALHTQGTSYILALIDEFIAKQESK